MTDPMIRMAHVREQIADQRAKLPEVDHNGKPLAKQPENPEQFAEFLAQVRDDETWQKIGPGWPQAKRHYEAIAAGVPVPSVDPELDGRLTPAQREAAAATFNAAIAAAQAAGVPTPPPVDGPRSPRPDPSQGGGGGEGIGLDTHIADAQRKGDWRTVISLQRQQLSNSPYGYGGTR